MQGADAAGGLTQTADRGFALVGQTASKGAGKNDFWLVRTDRNGTQMFDRAYGGTEDDTANGVVQMADGGFAIVGTTMSKGAGGADIWLVRTDSNGNKLWDRTYGGSSEEDGNGLAQLADGSLVVAAYSMSSELGSILRLDPQGNLVASNNTGTGAGRGTGMAIAAAGTTGVFVAGSRDSGTADFWLTRTDLWANMSCAKSGTCFAGTASSCDDGNQCTQDTCTFATGCSHTTWPATTPCNDGKDCTVGETCSAGGTCGGATNAASGTLCSDGNACTSGEACSSGVCTAGSGISCANDATCEAGVGCVCNPGYLGSGAQSGGSCNCKGTVVTVTLASGTQSACTYDYPVWGQRGLTPTTLKDNGNGTVGDSQTLLMWEQAVNNVTYTHADAVTHCDGLVLAGYADWRLPTYAELESIMDYSGNTSGAVIDTTLFPVAVDSVYRTMSVPDIVAGNRWTLDVFGGYADFQGDTQPHSVRCVRTHGARPGKVNIF